jgi:hypothetical protein
MQNYFAILQCLLPKIKFMVIPWERLLLQAPPAAPPVLPAAPGPSLLQVRGQCALGHFKHL